VLVPNGDGSARRVETDGEGRFVVPDLAWQSYEVRVGFEPTGERRVYHNSLTAVVLEDVVPSGEPLRIEIPAAQMPSCSFRGRILDVDGTVPPARVQIGHMDGQGVVTLVVDPDTGGFALGDLLPGPYWVTARADDRALLQVGRVELAPGEEHALGTLHLDRGRGTELSIRLQPTADLSPADLDRVEVQILDDHGRNAGTVARLGADHLRAGPLPSGSYRVQVRGEGIAIGSHPVEVVTGRDADIAVPVTAGARRRLRARLPAGAGSPEWVWVSIFAGKDVIAGTGLALQEDGSYLGEVWLGAGRYDAWFGSDGNTWHARCELTVDPTLADAPTAEVMLAKRQ
jgi:hypothetical protein